MRSTPASASIGHLFPLRLSWSWYRGAGRGAGCGDVGIRDVGMSVSGAGMRALLWTGLPQLEQNLAPGSSLFPQLLQYLSATVSSSIRLLLRTSYTS
jgi:hypothetical protein